MKLRSIRLLVVAIAVSLAHPLTQVALTSSASERVLAPAAKRVHHYVFFGMDRESIPNAKSFFDTKAFEGAQVAYSWRQLEQGKDNYDFSIIREDLELLKKLGKKLWIQFQDVTFT